MIGIERQKIGKKGRLWHKLRYGIMRPNEREATIGTAHTVTVNGLIESIKQTNKQTYWLGKRQRTTGP
jgi:hypothetical protein